MSEAGPNEAPNEKIVGEVWRGVSGVQTVAITRRSMRNREWYADPLGLVGVQVWRPEDGAWGNPATVREQADAFAAWGIAMSAEVARLTRELQQPS